MIHQAKSNRPLLDEQTFQSGLHPLPARPSGAYGAGFDSSNLRDDMKTDVLVGCTPRAVLGATLIIIAHSELNFRS
jgi:hypothetical protein